MQSIVITDFIDRPHWTNYDEFENLIGVRYNRNYLKTFSSIAFYDIIDPHLFFLSVIKYGITFVDANKYEWRDASGNLRNSHGIIKYDKT